MTTAIAPASDPAPVADGGPRLYGVVDVLRGGRIAGWVIDRADSAAAVEVEIRREGRLVATVRADRLRRDLERGGVGTGRYGFTCDLDPALQPGFEFTVSATARAADGATIRLRRAGSDDGDPSGEQRLLERMFEMLSVLSTAPTAMPPDDSIVEAIGRLELVQARIEAALSVVEPAPPPALRGLRILACVSLGVGAVSLAVGLASMLMS